jgi:hypothetical protein
VVVRTANPKIVQEKACEPAAKKLPIKILERASGKVRGRAAEIQCFILRRRKGKREERKKGKRRKENGKRKDRNKKYSLFPFLPFSLFPFLLT